MKRRLITVVGLLAAGIAWPAVASAVPVAGPTPTGTGSYAYCNVTQANASNANHQITMKCTYGIPADGVTLTGFELHYGEQGWLGFKSGGSYVVNNYSFCGNDAAINTSGEYTARECVGGFKPEPDAVRAVYSDGSRRQASMSFAMVDVVTWPDEPAYGFKSGLTGLADTYSSPPVTAVDRSFNDARTQLSGWMNAGALMVGGLSILGCGAFVLIAMLRRGAAAAGLDSGYGSFDGYDDAQVGFDDQSDDSGDDDGFGLNASDDLSDDDGEEMDEGSGEGVGLGDSDECVSCGASLSFGWDFDECPECGGI